MSREFQHKKTPTVELRDIIALLMPKPPTYVSSSTPDNIPQEVWFMAEMRARYSYADRIINEVR